MIPKKSLGQNFLIDKNICKKITNLTKLKDKTIIEIGPGKGILTNEILSHNPKKIILIEKDSLLFNKLSKKYQKNKIFEIYNKDALNFNYKKYNNIILLSNLPYNISVKIIYKLLKNRFIFNEIILMIQKEVAEKFDYKKKTKLNKHNFVINTLCKFKIMFNISNNVFYPKPKVKSSIIKLIPNKNLNIDFNILIKFTNKIFLHKRKKITNLLKKNKKINIDKKFIDKRAEDLSMNELLNIFKQYLNS
tara:strand:- start:198 stop:941 length:744 start_codon:yes stop_codon:yes gene_type:complete